MVFTLADSIMRQRWDAPLLTGTLVYPSPPAGASSTRQPQMFLAAIGRVSIEIEGIGRLTNPVGVA